MINRFLRFLKSIHSHSYEIKRIQGLTPTKNVIIFECKYCLKQHREIEKIEKIKELNA